MLRYGILRTRVHVTFVLALVTAACASVPSPEGSDNVAAPKRQRDVITNEEIMASPQHLVDLLQAIRGLRPQFLEPPLANHTHPNATLLYIDGVRQTGGLATLQSIPASSAERVEYLDPGRAESQLGSIATGGAVMVTLIGQQRTPQPPTDMSSGQR